MNCWQARKKDLETSSTGFVGFMMYFAECFSDIEAKSFTEGCLTTSLSVLASHCWRFKHINQAYKTLFAVLHWQKLALLFLLAAISN